jgi:hypothetical protein
MVAGDVEEVEKWKSGKVEKVETWKSKWKVSLDASF